MDYLEYKDFLAHGKIYVSYDGGKTQTEIKKKPSSNSLGARIKRRLSGKKPIGGQTTTGSSGGGKSGRKWKNHKYIAIINGRYIYPAKRSLKQTFTKSGRQAKRLALARSEGTARERAAISNKKYEHEYKNAEQAANEVAKVGKVKNKQSRDYGAAIQRKVEAEARRDKHLNESSKYILEREKHAKALAKMDKTEARINKLRSAFGKEANASSKVAAPAKKIVRSKKEQHELNQQAIESANKSNKKVNSKPQQQSPTSKPKKQSELSKSLKEIKDYAGKKIKNGEVTFGPDPETVAKAIQESKKKKKKR